jgi:hypothetical protein
MPGRLQRDFRFGNLAEHLGVLLLKGIAAVADVPRPEDVGLDAIATLLRPDDDDNYYAEDSFVVQLKSASATSIKYEGHELQWLIGQSQPMFIGLVSLAESTISLYPTIHVNHAVLAMHAQWVTVKFGVSDIPAFFRGQKWSPWKGEDNHGATVWLGDPLLSWTLADIVQTNWINNTYSTLKRFLTLARREIGLLALGQCSVLDWSTNDSDSITSQSGMMKGRPDDLDSIARQCAPCLHALMLRAMTSSDNAANALMMSLVTMADSLRKMGADVDPENLFGKFFFAVQSRNDSEDEGAT